MIHSCFPLVKFDFIGPFRILSLCVLLLAGAFGHAQVSQPHRYEREQGNSQNAYNIISLKEQGLAVVWDKERYKDGKKIWDVTFLDTALTEKYVLELPLETRFRLIGHEYVINSLYLLFRSGEGDSDFLHMVHVNLLNHDRRTYDIKHEFNLRLTHFSIVGDHALLGGYVVHEPAVMLYEMSSNQVKVIPGFFLNDTELLDLRVNVNNTFNAVLMDRGKKEKKNLTIRTYDEAGTLILEDLIELDRDKTVLAAQTSTLKRDELMVLGCYGEAKSKQAIGIFSVLVDPFNSQAIHFFDFAQFDHYLDFMPENRIAKIKAKAQHDREAGDLPSLRLHVQPVRMEEYNDGFILISEVYSPTSNLTAYPYWNNYYNPSGYYPFGFNSPSNRYYNTPYSPSMSTSTDYKMMETAVTFFDAQGKYIWDHSLKLPDIHSPALDQTGDFAFLDDRTVIGYKGEEDIKIKTRFKHDHQATDDTIKISMKSPTDALRYDSKSDGGFRYWYQTSFYIWGFQSIKDRAREGDQTRYVFFINKVTVD